MVSWTKDNGSQGRPKRWRRREREKSSLTAARTADLTVLSVGRYVRNRMQFFGFDDTSRKPFSFFVFLQDEQKERK